MPSDTAGALAALLVCLLAVLNGLRIATDVARWDAAPPPPPASLRPPHDSVLDAHFAAFLTQAGWRQLALETAFGGSAASQQPPVGDWRGWARHRLQLWRAERALRGELVDVYGRTTAEAGLAPPSGSKHEGVSRAYYSALVDAQLQVVAAHLTTPQARAGYAERLGERILATAARNSALKPAAGAALPSLFVADVDALLTTFKLVGYAADLQASYPRALGKSGSGTLSLSIASPAALGTVHAAPEISGGVHLTATLTALLRSHGVGAVWDGDEAQVGHLEGSSSLTRTATLSRL